MQIKLLIYKDTQMKKYIKFRKNTKEANPHFLDKEWNEIKNIKGKLEAVYYNEEREVQWTEKKFTAPEWITVKVVDWDNEQYLELNTMYWPITRWFINELLSSNIWDNVIIETYKTKKGYKVVTIKNADKPKTFKYKDKDWKDAEFETFESYSWAVDLKDIPAIYYIKNKKWEVVNVDDDEANEFFFNKIKDKFVSPNKKDKEEEVTVEDLPFN